MILEELLAEVTKLHEENRMLNWQKEQLEAKVNALRADKERLETARPYTEWHEDLGPVLWHMMPIQCAPYVGDPMCCDWPFKTDRNLFWTPLPDCNLIQDRFEAARKGEPK